jgi:hypothetical protein
MRKPLVILLSAAALIASGTLIASATSSHTVVTNGDEGEAVAPCQSKQKTGLVKGACKKGGQKAAKKAMKSWVKKVKKARKAGGETGFKLTCKACHSSLKGAYPLKADGLDQFKKHDAWLKAQK